MLVPALVRLVVCLIVVFRDPLDLRRGVLRFVAELDHDWTRGMMNCVLELNNSQSANSFNSLVEKFNMQRSPNQPNQNPNQSVIDRGR